MANFLTIGCGGRCQPTGDSDESQPRGHGQLPESSLAGSAQIGSLVSTSPSFRPTLNWCIMSWSSCGRLWQCTMYLPLCGPNFMINRTFSPSPTYTTSLGPSSQANGALPLRFRILKSMRWICTGWNHPPDLFSISQISVSFRPGFASTDLYPESTT